MKVSKWPEIISTNIFEDKDSISQYHPGIETPIKILHSGLYV